MGAPPAPPAYCPTCTRATEPDARFCEECGGDLHATPGERPVWRSSGEDRAVLDLTAVAGVSDRARRPRNEDAVAVGRAGSAVAAVVCDGVSSTDRSGEAARAAAAHGMEALLGAVAGGGLAAATRAGIAAAAEAAAGVARPGDTSPPCCTYVSALAVGSTVVIGWVGDSRAYWLAGADSLMLTVDDTEAGQMAAEGVPADDPRYAVPAAHALVRWLGADLPDVTPHLATFVAPGPGLVLVCSDGLSYYLGAGTSDPAALGDPTDPAATAAALVRYAVGAGGHDNVTAAVMSLPTVPVPPGESRP